MQNWSHSLTHSWQQVHEVLTARQHARPPAEDVFGMALYYYCVYKALGPEHAAPARQTFEQLAAHLTQAWFTTWPATELRQACIAAWLGGQMAAEGLLPGRAATTLSQLDLALQQEAQRLAPLADATSRSNFFWVVRYFALRHPQPAAGLSLAQLVALAPARPDGPEPLGLATGLAAELLILISLHHSGLRDSDLQHQVHAGVQRILALRRDVDFSEQRYSVFPYQVHATSREATFSPELSWRRGDLGQVLLLYKAHGLLQAPELAKMADLIGLNTLLRTSPPTTEIAGSPLYQGAAGVAHLYHKLYQASGQEAYRQGQQFWLTQTQHWLRQELAAGTCLPHESELLHGLVGVGLVLLSATTDKAPEWDAVLL